MKTYNNKWFTLIELLIALTIWMIVTVVVFHFVVDFRKQLYLTKIKSQSQTNISIVNLQLWGMVKNSYWIDYDQVDLSTDLDKIVLYTDKLENNTLSIYVKQDLDNDISRIYLSQWWQEIPLHSTALFIEEFNIEVSPKSTGTFTDIQPWVSMDIVARTRSPLLQPTDDKYYDLYNRSDSHLKWRWVIRNFVPSSIKN